MKLYILFCAGHKVYFTVDFKFEKSILSSQTDFQTSCAERKKRTPEWCIVEHINCGWPLTRNAEMHTIDPFFVEYACGAIRGTGRIMAWLRILNCIQEESWKFVSSARRKFSNEFSSFGNNFCIYHLFNLLSHLKTSIQLLVFRGQRISSPVQ